MSVAKTPTAAILVTRLLRRVPKMKDLALVLSTQAGRKIWRQQLTRWLAGGGISEANRRLLQSYLLERKGKQK